MCCSCCWWLFKVTSWLKNSKGAESYQFCLKFLKVNDKHFGSIQHEKSPYYNWHKKRGNLFFSCNEKYFYYGYSSWSSTSLNTHIIPLNCNHCPSRLTNLSNTYSVRYLLTCLILTLKKTILSNVIENINSQSQMNTITEFSSAFDLNLTIGLEEHKELPKKLCSIYLFKVWA